MYNLKMDDLTLLSAAKYETPEKLSPFEDPEEQAHFRSVVSAFFFYQYEAMRDIARMERDFSSMQAKYV